MLYYRNYTILFFTFFKDILIRKWRMKMTPIIKTRAFLLLPVLFLLIVGCAQTEAPEVESNPDLAAHTAEFKKDIIKITDGVYVAIGYGLANSTLLEGRDGVIIVDTLESVEAAREVKKEFDRITKKPVKAIIYTHFHTDHTFGATVFAGKRKPDIYSHEITLTYLDRIVSITRETTYRRAMRQFGNFLPEEDYVNAGIGHRLLFTENNTIGLIRPNKTFSGERLNLEIAGLKLELVHAPGETPDQIYIWMPEKKVLLCADNYYKSFPNLYAIRGTAYRDVMLWVQSLDKMRALPAEYLVPHHTRPIAGAKKIHETLTNYRDAIQYVHDQTIRLINKGLTTDEIVEQVKLPPHLANQPYLHEYYGTVAWSVRAIFDGYLGWFGGNATDLFPLPLKERAERFASLAGGEDALREKAREALLKRDFQWALELADQLILLDPDDGDAREIRVQSLTALGKEQIAATGRNYYLTQALETKGALKIAVMQNKQKEVVHAIPLISIFKGMAVHLNPEKSAEVNTIVGFRFPDTGEAYTVHVRRGVAEIQPRFPAKPDISVTVPSTVWKEIVAGLRNPALALVGGDVRITGGTLNLVRFLGLFNDD